MRNVVPVAKYTEQEGVPVIKQGVVPNIFIESRNKESFVNFTVYDFHLFDWQEVAYTEIMDSGEKVLLERIKGRVCFPTVPLKSSLSLEGGTPAKQEKPLKKEPEKEPCWSCSWALRIISALIFLFACGLNAALLFFTLVTVVCWIEPLLSSKGGSRLVLWLTLVITSAIGIYYLQVDSCENQLYLILPGLAFTLSLFLKRCWQKFSLLLMWFVALWLWCDSCRSTPVQPEEAPKTEVEEKIKSKQARETVDDVAEKLKAEGKGTFNFSDNSLFAFNKAVIRQEGEAELDKLLNLMKEYPTGSLEIIGHTDQQGEETKEGKQRNNELSKERAEAISNWLVEKGIPKKSLSTSGKGSQNPIYELPKTDEEYEANRRVEYKFTVEGVDKSAM